MAALALCLLRCPVPWEVAFCSLLCVASCVAYLVTLHSSVLFSSISCVVHCCPAWLRAVSLSF